MICYDRYSFERDANLPTDGKGDRQLRCIITIITTIVLYQIFLDYINVSRLDTKIKWIS